MNAMTQNHVSDLQYMAPALQGMPNQVEARAAIDTFANAAVSNPQVYTQAMDSLRTHQYDSPQAAAAHMTQLAGWMQQHHGVTSEHHAPAVGPVQTLQAAELNYHANSLAHSAPMLALNSTGPEMQTITSASSQLAGQSVAVASDVMATLAYAAVHNPQGYHQVMHDVVQHSQNHTPQESAQYLAQVADRLPHDPGHTYSGQHYSPQQGTQIAYSGSGYSGPIYPAASRSAGNPATPQGPAERPPAPAQHSADLASQLQQAQRYTQLKGKRQLSQEEEEELIRLAKKLGFGN
jgi:hypothetical protein